MQYFERTMKVGLTFFGGGVKQKVTLHDERGEGGLGKKVIFVTKGGVGIQSKSKYIRVVF